MNELTAALKEELNVDTAFTLPIFGGIDIPESIAVSWGIMAFLVIVSILLTRNLKVNHISKRQAILETAVVTMDNFFKDLLGEAGKQYVPYGCTVHCLLQPDRHHWSQAPHKGPECYRSAGYYEYCADRIFRHPCKGRQAICTQPGGTHCPDDPHEHSGNRHPGAVSI
jgi:hypothetical protein